MFKIDNWGSDTSNAKGMMAGQRYYRYFNEENNDITASGYFPANLCLEKGDRIVVIPSDTDNADELYVVTAVSAGVATIAKATSSGVTSVNGKTGDVVIPTVKTTITLAAADWSDDSQTASVTGITADGVVIVSPDPTDQSDYTTAGIVCTAQAAGSLTFTCTQTPTNDIDVNVVML